MLYLIGLGLNEKGFSFETYDILKKCGKIYLEEYTIEFPYKKELLEKAINNSKKEEIAILVYGSPLTATTHISLLLELKKNKVEYQVIHNASIVDAIAETGLQTYKFGKITSMPTWQKGFKPESFIETIRENQSINAHSLILVDIGLEFGRALEQLETAGKDKIMMDKIIVCSRLGTKEGKIFYDDIQNLMKKKVKAPYCIIIPSGLHFMEQEFIENYAS
ncbi:diphthine synthase [Candidatus Pacearchaeota archaeon]|nr:diphthine synthase [Candidatus Pacearchaeota archaeon]